MINDSDITASCSMLDSHIHSKMNFKTETKLESAVAFDSMSVRRFDATIELLPLGF